MNTLDRDVAQIVKGKRFRAQLAKAHEKNPLLHLTSTKSDSPIAPTLREQIKHVTEAIMNNLEIAMISTFPETTKLIGQCQNLLKELSAELPNYSYPVDPNRALLGAASSVHNAVGSVVLPKVIYTDCNGRITTMTIHATDPYYSILESFMGKHNHNSHATRKSLAHTESRDYVQSRIKFSKSTQTEQPTAAATTATNGPLPEVESNWSRSEPNSASRHVVHPGLPFSASSSEVQIVRPDGMESVQFARVGSSVQGSLRNSRSFVMEDDDNGSVGSPEVVDHTYPPEEEVNSVKLHELRALSTSLTRQLTDAQQSIQKLSVENSLLEGKLHGRSKDITKLRESLYKELLELREQLHQLKYRRTGEVDTRVEEVVSMMDFLFLSLGSEEDTLNNTLTTMKLKNEELQRTIDSLKSELLSEKVLHDRKLREIIREKTTEVELLKKRTDVDSIRMLVTDSFIRPLKVEFVSMKNFVHNTLQDTTLFLSELSQQLQPQLHQWDLDRKENDLNGKALSALIDSVVHMQFVFALFVQPNFSDNNNPFRAAAAPIHRHAQLCFTPTIVDLIAPALHKIHEVGSNIANFILALHEIGTGDPSKLPQYETLPPVNLRPPSRSDMADTFSMGTTSPSPSIGCSVPNSPSIATSPSPVNFSPFRLKAKKIAADSNILTPTPPRRIHSAARIRQRTKGISNNHSKGRGSSGTPRNGGDGITIDVDDSSPDSTVSGSPHKLYGGGRDGSSLYNVSFDQDITDEVEIHEPTKLTKSKSRRGRKECSSPSPSKSPTHMNMTPTMASIDQSLHAMRQRRLSELSDIIEVGDTTEVGTSTLAAPSPTKLRHKKNGGNNNASPVVIEKTHFYDINVLENGEEEVHVVSPREAEQQRQHRLSFSSTVSSQGNGSAKALATARRGSRSFSSFNSGTPDNAVSLLSQFYKSSTFRNARRSSLMSSRTLPNL